MDENFVMWLFFVVLVVLLAIIFGVMFLCSEANLRGLKDGFQEGFQKNEFYYRHMIDILRGRIKAMELVLEMYRDISTTFCDKMSDCIYCPYECDKDDHWCIIWELNDVVDRFGIKEFHISTKYD